MITNQVLRRRAAIIHQRASWRRNSPPPRVENDNGQVRKTWPSTHSASVAAYDVR